VVCEVSDLHGTMSIVFENVGGAHESPWLMIVDRDTDEKITKVIIEVVDAGTLRMPSGRLVAKDPARIDDRDQPFTVTVPPGEYPVRLSVARFADNPEHKRVPAAKLVIRDEPAQSWEMALVPGQDPRTLTDTAFYGFGVDAGWDTRPGSDAPQAAMSSASSPTCSSCPTTQHRKPADCRTTKLNIDGTYRGFCSTVKSWADGFFHRSIAFSLASVGRRYLARH
jgi:Protein of unknown function (DUF4241)